MVNLSLWIYKTRLATKLEVNVPSVFQLKLTTDYFFYCLESIIPLPFCNSFILVYKPPRKYTMIILSLQYCKQAETGGQEWPENKANVVVLFLTAS